MLSESSCVNIASQEKWHKQKWQQLWGYIKLFMPTTLHSAKFSKTLESLLEMGYMFFKFWLLANGSRDLSQAEKEITTCKADQIHKITTIFNQNNKLWPFSSVFFKFAQRSTLFFLSRGRSKTADMDNASFCTRLG